MEPKKDLKEKQSKLEKLNKQISELDELKDRIDADIKNQRKIESGETELEEKIKNLHRFPGSLSEYNSLMNQEHVIMNIGESENFVNIDHSYKKESQLLKTLIDKGCTGVIRYVPLGYMVLESGEHGNSDSTGGYGIPVRKK